MTLLRAIGAAFLALIRQVREARAVAALSLETMLAESQSPGVLPVTRQGIPPSPPLPAPAAPGVVASTRRLELATANKRFLVGSGVTHVDSPNHSGPFAPGLPDTLLIHFTAGGTIEGAISTLTDPKTRTSAHVVIGRDGAIRQLVPFDWVAWHAGESAWAGRFGLNAYAVGIELVNWGRLQVRSGVHGPETLVSWTGTEVPREDAVQLRHSFEGQLSWWQQYTELQLEACEQLCELLVEHYSIRWFLGHEHVSPGRKLDPGPAFPLDEMRGRLGVRHDEEVGA